MKLWSISTTVRNPERLRNFLKVLQLLEGKPFDLNNQTKYQILLIQHKYYIPNNIPDEFKVYYEKLDLEMPYSVAEKIFNYQNYEDPAMRGRQSVNPLNKLGFSIAREKSGNIIITELGKRFLKDEYDIGYIFFKSLLKLQFPNPWSNDFSSEKGFNVQPLIATMHLINKVNQKSYDNTGLSQTEFSLFVPSLINYTLIDEYVSKVLEYRKTKNKDKFILNFARDFYKIEQPSEKQINNFFEYGDNIMRYFRLTRYFKVTSDNFGANWRINLEPTRNVEIQQLLKKYSGEAIEKFEKLEQYLKYLSDIAQPELPFENIDNLQKIASELVKIIASFVEQNNLHLFETDKKLLNENYKDYTKEELHNYIKSLRDLNIALKESLNKKYLLNNQDKIEEIISNLKNYKTVKKFAPEKFEQIITESLKIINDEIKIKPNYPVDDNGQPITHASGNQPDIECYYKTFNLICEVTLDTTNYQWIRETQTVMRHLRDFEKKYPQSLNYCLFISPKIHIDTVYHFWTSIKFGYDGYRQKIIPLTTDQFSVLLETLVHLLKKGKGFSHIEIRELYDKILSITENVNGHSEWLENISKIIDQWKLNIIEK
jgi:hypothetical protein